jgi:hypothetical protein
VKNDLRDQLKSSGKMFSPARHTAIISAENLFATTTNTRHSQYDLREKALKQARPATMPERTEDDDNIHAFDDSDVAF